MLALLTLNFVGLAQGASSVFGSNIAIHDFMHDARHVLGFPATTRPGRSERGGDSPKFFGHGGVRPGQPAQHDISGTRIQVTLKLMPDRFR